MKSPKKGPQPLDSEHPNLIHVLVGSGLPPLTALAEAKENMGPGTDTTSATLAHILWALAHNVEFQEALHDDLSSVLFSSDMTTLEGVPRLRACIKEGIRWTGAAAAMLPRIVPEGGVEICGTFFPANVRVFLFLLVVITTDSQSVVIDCAQLFANMVPTRQSRFP